MNAGFDVTTIDMSPTLRTAVGPELNILDGYFD
jgi:hypothetical protein